MSAATRALVEGWDAYSVAQARAYLLREAASALLQAQTKWTPGDRVVALSTLVTRCIVRVNEVGAGCVEVTEAPVTIAVTWSPEAARDMQAMTSPTPAPSPRVGVLLDAPRLSTEPAAKPVQLGFGAGW